MAEYPNDIFEARETENLPGLVYNPADKKNMYSEDFQNLGAEITAIETALGANLSKISLGEFNVMSYGAIGDGASNPLSSLFASITLAAVKYPFLTTVYHINITNVGSGYSSAPTISFAGGGGTGAAATAYVLDGKIVAIKITAPGSGYTSAPTISFAGGGGSSAAATALVGLLTDEIDWAALQTAINVAAGVTSQGLDAIRSGTVILPQPANGSRLYRINQTLRYRGGPSFSLTMKGANFRTHGPSGTIIAWYGASGGTVFSMVGGAALFQDMDFWGRNIAKYCIHFDAYNTVGASNGLSGVEFNRVTILEATGSGSACVVVGHILVAGEYTVQVDDISFTRCLLQSADYGFYQLSAGNTRNIKFFETVVLYMNKWGLSLHSGACMYIGGSMGGNGDATEGGDFEVQGSSMIIDSMSSELSARFLFGTTGSNFGSVSVRNIDWNNGDNLVADDIIVNYSGALTLIGNSFINQRTGSSFCKIYVGSLIVAPSPDNAPGSILSIGNYYRYATDYAPIYDGGGNKIFGPGSYNTGKTLSATSIGDLGGVSGTLVRLIQVLPSGDMNGVQTLIGKFIIKGLGNTYDTASLDLLNSDGEHLALVKNDGRVYIGPDTAQNAHLTVTNTADGFSGGNLLYLQDQTVEDDLAMRSYMADGHILKFIFVGDKGSFRWGNSSLNEDQMILNTVTGNLGIGVAPTAKLHLKASEAAADKASAKIEPGTVATTPVSGNVESDGTHLYWTDSGGTRRQLDN